MRKKVTIVGSGNVGASTALRLADRELADQLAARVAKSHRALGVPNDDLIGRERMAKATRLAQEEYLASVSPAGFVAYQSGQAA